VRDGWVQAQVGGGGLRLALIAEDTLRAQCEEILGQIQLAAEKGGGRDIEGPAWGDARRSLERISQSRAQQGFTPSETALFVFSLKDPLLEAVRTELAAEAGALTATILGASAVIDRLGIFTIEAYQRGREAVIARQQQDMLELSTPVVKLWDGILAVPLIGTLDSERTQVVMETLLREIADTGSEIAIIDITGVPTVDTRVAQHLLQTVSAARLMGADCIVSGIRPQIAQTIVHLGLNLPDVITKANLADAFRLALSRQGLRLTADRQ